MGQTVGILAGAVIAAAVTGDFAAGYVVCAGALLAGVVLYFFKNDDVPLPRGGPAAVRSGDLSARASGFPRSATRTSRGPG